MSLVRGDRAAVDWLVKTTEDGFDSIASLSATIAAAPHESNCLPEFPRVVMLGLFSMVP